MRPLVLLLLLLGITLASVLLSLTSGSVSIDPRALLTILNGGGDELGRQIILELRGPRTLAAFTTGALLSIAGALMQVLLRNPLADPYVLGISGGAATGALLALLLGLGSIALHSAAFAGALLSMLLVFGLSHGSGSWTTHRLLLTGVVVAAGWGAAIGFLLALSPDQGLRGMLFWLMGDLSYAASPLPALLIMLIGLILAMIMGRSLNIFSRGEQTAASLGINVIPLRRIIYVLASLLTATAVTLAGSIGFVGLIIPHMLRLTGIRDYRLLLPAATLLGGSLLVIADTLARTLLAPRQLPVGILTALVGVPLFLLLLHHSRNLQGNSR